MQRLTQQWQELCTRYLPSVREGSPLWRYNRPPRPEDAKQGWKLHISATLFNVHRALERVAPLLIERGVQFKAPASLEVLRQINSGLETSYSQVGKVITVYPRNDEEAVLLARKLHRLTRRLLAPTVPFDRRYRKKSNVYYRYGAFFSLEMKLPNGESTCAIRSPDGELLPDLCGPGLEKPAWVENPFKQSSPRLTRIVHDSPLKSSFRPFRALSQRGKGGVYQAVDLTVSPPRLCLLKEGRRAGEIGWDRQDGRSRIRHEQRVISELRELGIDVPRVYSSFESGGNYYLVTEFFDGESLQSYLMKRQRRLRIHQVVSYASQLANFIARLHAAGWIWRDCKPSNLILTTKKELKPVDFESTCRLNEPETLPWISPAFRPRKIGGHHKGVAYDLYALGAVTYLLLTGRLPDPDRVAAPAEKFRRNTPPSLSSLLTKLLNPSEYQTLDASTVTEHFRKITMELAAAG